MLRGQCIAAAQDLLRTQLCSSATALLDSGLLQRMQSSWFCSTSSAAATCSSSSSSHTAHQNSSSSCCSSSQLPAQQPFSSSHSWQQTRYYAPAARFEDRYSPGRQDGSDQSSSRGHQRLAQLPKLRLGRSVDLMKATEQLWEAHDLQEERDPFENTDPLDIMPIEVDGRRGDGLEEPMLLRQQLENSALPNEFKRAQLGSPDWDEILLDVNRTIKVTKGGKVETLHALVVVGNQNGLLGVGQHSGKNIQKVILDAQLKAYQNLVAIPRYRGHTVYHPIDLKLRKIRLQAWPRQLGFGVTASPIVTELCDLAGLKNITVKLSGNRKNLRNLVQVFVEAMSHQSVPHDGVEGSGVYMREVFRGKLPCGLKRGVHVP